MNCSIPVTKTGGSLYTAPTDSYNKERKARSLHMLRALQLSVSFVK